MGKPVGANPKEPAMKTLLMFATSVAILAAAPYAAQAQQTTIRDSRGSTVGTATQSGNTTTFRDTRGSTTGTATTSSSGQTAYRDNRGSTVGTSTGPRR
jgi:opacity protein-like surface antigen